MALFPQWIWIINQCLPHQRINLLSYAYSMASTYVTRGELPLMTSMLLLDALTGEMAARGPRVETWTSIILMQENKGAFKREDVIEEEIACMQSNAAEHLWFSWAIYKITFTAASRKHPMRWGLSTTYRKNLCQSEINIIPLWLLQLVIRIPKYANMQLCAWYAADMYWSSQDVTSFTAPWTKWNHEVKLVQHKYKCRHVRLRWGTFTTYVDKRDSNT